jgi:FtsH-binding integral membrane protein
MLVQLGLVFWLSSQILNLSVTTATIGFSIYATLNGVLFSTIFLVYTGASIASTFVVTAGMFGAISLYGFTTKKDLSSVGSFCFMALIGLILASIVDWFFRSPFLYWVITYAGIAIFIGLTAWDTQALKQIHQQGFSSESAMKKIALLGALKLYLDFINLFLLLLRILGSRRR